MGCFCMYTQQQNNQEILDFLKTIESTPDFAYRSDIEPGGCKQIWVRTTYADDHGKPQDRYVKLVHFYQNCNDMQNCNNMVNRAGTVTFQHSCDYYTTKNSFFGGFRRNDQLFSFDNIVIDIDVHGRPLEWYEKELDWEIDRLVFTLQTDYTFPVFNMVRSGRGVQLWIALESFSARVPALEKRYTTICDHLCNIVDDAIQAIGSPLSIDRAATKNPSGLVRIPYTANQKRYNPKTQKDYYATFNCRTDRRYSIDELLDYIPTNTNKPAKKSEPAKFKKINATDNPFEYGINMKRIMFLRQIVQDRVGDCEGRRELLAWAYYNALVQVMEITDADKELHSFNSNFYEPLSTSEIDAIIMEFERKRDNIGAPIPSMHNGMREPGYYIMTSETFLEKISATDDEIAMFSKLGAKERERQKKRDAKELRNARIREMRRNGATLKAIAEEVSCTERTVRTVLQQQNSQKPDKETRNRAILTLHNDGKSVREIATLVGCSPSTVQTIIKESESEKTKPTTEKPEPTQTEEKVWTKPETYCSAEWSEWCESHLQNHSFPSG